MKYHKIDSIFKRNKQGALLWSDWSTPEFDYLKDLSWRFDEKIDGTNLRIEVHANRKVRIGGRTDDAQLSTVLFEFLQDEFLDNAALLGQFPDGGILYGEGLDPQNKSATPYCPDGKCAFVLFDVRVVNWWLKREAVEKVGQTLELPVAPIVSYGTIAQAIDITRTGFNSAWGDFPAEGLVLRPAVDLFDRGGNRIITKIKTRDFKNVVYDTPTA